MSNDALQRACLDGCTEAQCEAIRHVEGPLLVLAGPGSGKTRVITRRIAHLAASGAPPSSLLAITFTNKAAGEMRDRVAAMGMASGACLSTFHSFCARILRRFAGEVGLTPSFSIYDTSDSLAAVKRILREMDTDTTEVKPARVLREISNAKNRLQTPEQVGASPLDHAEVIAEAYLRYEKLLKNSNAADFDDLLLHAVRLFDLDGRAAQTLRRTYRYVLIDEYQDTNRAQYLLARHLAAEHRNLCATGDPDQSIYGWRGADVKNILDFERDYPDCKVVRLEQNFRSTRRILLAASRLIENNIARKAKALFTEGPEGERIGLLRAEDESSEAQQVAEAIAQRVSAGEASPRDIAVFYRVNAQSRTLEASLRAERLPYTIVAGTEFYERAEVKDLLAYLRLVVNPDDSVSAERVANVPARRLGDTSVKKIRAWGAAQGLPLFRALARAAEAGVGAQAAAGAAAFVAVVNRLAALPQRPVADLVRSLIESVRYEDYLRTLDNADERVRNMLELVNAGAEYDRAEPEGDLGGFLEQIALVSDVDRWDPARGAVTLMTLHSAKGLEFPYVYIVGLEEGLLPLRGDESPQELEEERRLLFVGITRAKKAVTLSFAEARARYGRTEFTRPSRFLEEIPPEVLAGSAGDSRPAPGRRESLFRAAPAAPVRSVQRTEHEVVVYDEEPCEETPFAVGDTVTHPSYGRGRVMEIGGYGENMRATVRFHTVGVKRLVLKFARLRKV